MSLTNNLGKIIYIIFWGSVSILLWFVYKDIFGTLSFIVITLIFALCSTMAICTYNFVKRLWIKLMDIF
jgi:hypothetical protein